MRVGIITFHCSYNYGSALQAYALQQQIDNLGHSSLIIDYRSRDFRQYRLLRLRNPKNMLYDALNIRRRLRRKKSFEGFWRDWLKLTEKTYTYRNESGLNTLQDQFDCFVCGSDQIWNLNCTHGVNGPFFLSFAGKCRRVAYGPSLARTHFNEAYFDSNLVAKLLAPFDKISVREADTIPVFQALTPQTIECVCDPTMLLGRRDYESIIPACPMGDEPYVFLYLLRSCPELVESAKSIAKGSGKKIAYISDQDLRIDGSLNMYGANPLEFVSLIANADAVLSNSFHATVFSAIFERDFVSISTAPTRTRMQELVSSMALDRCFTTRPVDSVPHVDDWSRAQETIDDMRRHSLEFLGDALA